MENHSELEFPVWSSNAILRPLQWSQLHAELAR